MERVHRAPTETASEAGPKGAPPLIVLPSSHEYAQLISDGREPAVTCTVLYASGAWGVGEAVAGMEAKAVGVIALEELLVIWQGGERPVPDEPREVNDFKRVEVVAIPPVS